MSKVSTQSVQIATHEGVISLGGHRIPCAVLEGGTRVLQLSAIKKLIGRRGKNDARNLKVSRKSLDEHCFTPADFLLSNNIKPFASHELQDPASLLNYKTKNGQIARGCKASVLPDLLGAYLRARQAGKLRANQAHIAEACEILLLAFANVGRNVLAMKQEVADV